MSAFTIHSHDTAPDAAKPLLEKSQAAFGRIPSLHGALAEAPGVLDGYQILHKLFLNTSFDNDEKTVVWQTINVEHECHYCVPGHTAIANAMKVDPAITEALRNETPLPTERLEALRTFTLAVLRNRGHVTEDNLSAFHAAGYTKAQVFEVILGLSQKVISNYVNHIAETPIDAPVQKYAWTRVKDEAAE
jgi:alkylhydroperoxidase family enzyme